MGVWLTESAVACGTARLGNAAPIFLLSQPTRSTGMVLWGRSKPQVALPVDMTLGGNSPALQHSKVRRVGL